MMCYVTVSGSTIDWGSVPDWGAAVGTLLAFGIVFVGLRRERRRRRQDEARWEGDRRRLEDERRDLEATQARLVSADIAWQFDHSNGYTAAVDVLNESDHSVRDVEAWLVPTTPPSGGWPEEQPGTSSLARAARSKRVPADDRLRLVLAPPHRFTPPGDGIQQPHQWAISGAYEVRFQFTDTRGLRWQRNGHEQPERVIRVESAVELGWRTSAPTKPAAES
jgi:hypothetical protein